MSKRRISFDKEIEKELLLEKKEVKGNIRNRKKAKISKKIKQFFTFNFVLGSICCFLGLFLLYGPYSGFRDWLITTAMTTMTHQYFATWFYDDETIDAVLAKNTVIESSTPTDTDLIEIVDYGNEEITYENEFERQILENPNNEDYKIIEIEGDGYSGYLAVIYDPSRVHTVTTKYLNSRGEYLVDMAERVDALVAINGGGFIDPNFNSNGATPVGITISHNVMLTSASWNGSGGIIGFTEDNVLVLGKYSSAQVKSLGIRDAVTFGPFLIVNGEPSEVLGNGGWGSAPRTVIGQRKDGIVLFLVIDGRTISKPGADMDDLIEIMQNYGAYNAANLDGGTSSVMVVDGEIINDPIDSTGAHRTRWIASGFYLAPEE